MVHVISKRGRQRSREIGEDEEIEDAFASRSHPLTGPFCEAHDLQPFGPSSASCEYCGGLLGGALLQTLSRSSPSSVTTVSPEPQTHSKSYRHGREDGRYEEPLRFTENRRLALLQAPTERLDYYRGHRAGRGIRLRDEPHTS